MQLGSWFLLGLVPITHLTASDPVLSFTVRVFNSAGVPGGTVARAEREVASVMSIK